MCDGKMTGGTAVECWFGAVGEQLPLCEREMNFFFPLHCV